MPNPSTEKHREVSRRVAQLRADASEEALAEAARIENELEGGEADDAEPVAEFASKNAEAKAAERGVELDELEPGEGSGSGGKYTVADIEEVAS